MTGRTTASKYSRSRFLMKKWSSWQLYSDRCLSFWSRVRLLQLLTKLSFAHVEHVLLLVFWISLRISLTFYRSSISLTSEDVMSSMKSDWSLKRQILVRDSVSPLLSSSAFFSVKSLDGHWTSLASSSDRKCWATDSLSETTTRMLEKFFSLSFLYKISPFSLGLMLKTCKG